MKKQLLLISLAAVMVLFSCKKDDDSSPYDAAYTDESPEISKAAVEQNAIDLMDNMEDMATATGIQVLMNLNNLQSGSTKSTSSSSIMKPLMLVSAIDGKEDIAAVLEGLKEFGELIEEDPQTLSDMFDEIEGKYTYNFSTGEFDESELADKVVFEFPGKETDQTNTAVLTIDNFAVVEISEPIDQLPSELTELPKSVRVVLQYNNVSIAGASFAASYTSAGLPTKVTVSVWVDEFTLTAAVTHSPYSSASWRNTLTYQSNILFETYIAAGGNWSEENIGNNVIEDEDGTEVHIEEIIKNANAHVIMMNIKVVGMVNIKVLGDAIWALEEQYETMAEEEWAQATVDAINANAKLVVIYRDSNQKVAEAEAYVDSYYDSYSEETDYYPAMRFVYSDGSYVDAETYVGEQLDGLYTSMNDFIDMLNAEYDLNLEYVGPPTK